MVSEAEQAKSAALLRAQKADVERQEALDAANVASVIPDSVPALRAALEETRAQVARYKKALKEMGTALAMHGTEIKEVESNAGSKSSELTEQISQLKAQLEAAEGKITSTPQFVAMRKQMERKGAIVNQLRTIMLEKGWDGDMPQ